MPDDVPTLELQFAEEMGQFFEGGGLTRMAGRVWAMLLVMNEPYLSAADLRDALGASAGSISGATRSLLQLGLIERVNVRGERRDYFAPRRGAIVNTLWLQLQRLVAIEDMLNTRFPTSRMFTISTTGTPESFPSSTIASSPTKRPGGWPPHQKRGDLQ